MQILYFSPILEISERPIIRIIIRPAIFEILSAEEDGLLFNFFNLIPILSFLENKIPEHLHL
jgi:hypothetical protein